MNKSETKRFTHKIAADTLTTARDALSATPLRQSFDWDSIFEALTEIIEQHKRFGPKSSDRAPREPEKIANGDTPLPFEDVDVFELKAQ